MRLCVICGEPLVGMRSDALSHSGFCRAERNRDTAILSGSANADYPSMAHRLGVASKRTRRLYGLVPEGDEPHDVEPNESNTPDVELIGPKEFARRVGVSRGFVYDHADELGAQRIGKGPRRRLWFIWPDALERIRSRSRAESATPTQNSLGGGRKAGRLVTLREDIPLMPYDDREGT